MTSNLTVIQRETLDFICAYKTAHGQIPTFRQIMTGLGVKSISSVSQRLKALEAKGYISRTSALARGIKILFKPDDAADWQGIALTLAEENKALRDIVSTIGGKAPPQKVVL
jgi:SOS-response transcriptional repressor LexA